MNISANSGDFNMKLKPSQKAITLSFKTWLLQTSDRVWNHQKFQ